MNEGKRPDPPCRMESGMFDLECTKTYSGVSHFEPAGQAVQLVAFGKPLVVAPSGHLTEFSFALGHMCPSGQSVQVVWPSSENVPAVQTVMVAAGFGHEYPAGHNTHSAIP